MSETNVHWRGWGQHCDRDIHRCSHCGNRIGASTARAIDWKQVEAATSFSDDARDKRSYYAYGKPVRAVADLQSESVRVKV